MNKEDIAKCHFVPISTLKKVMEHIGAHDNKFGKHRCKRNLVSVQSNKLERNVYLSRRTWFNAFQMAVRRAIYSHDWNCLAFMLKKVPIWEHRAGTRMYKDLPIYMRALTILLMNHPSSKAQSLLDDYLHMVLACRSDEDKKAVYKTLLSLPDRLYGRKANINSQNW